MERSNQTSNAALYGAGVFTTLVFADGEPLLWEKHARRLESNARRIGLASPAGSELLSALRNQIACSGLSTGRARVSLHDESESALWSAGLRRRTGISVLIAPHRALPDVFQITLSDFRVNTRSPIAGVKSINYLENLLALEASRYAGFDEALRLNEHGAIVSASCANIFWITDGKLCTPSLETGCLAGTTREFVIECFPVEEVNAKPTAIERSDAILLTSAGIGARRAEFRGVRFKFDALADEVVRTVRRTYRIGDDDT